MQMTLGTHGNSYQASTRQASTRGSLNDLRMPSAMETQRAAQNQGASQSHELNELSTKNASRIAKDHLLLTEGFKYLSFSARRFAQSEFAQSQGKFARSQAA
jgi:hypothetical protein